MGTKKAEFTKKNLKKFLQELCERNIQFKCIYLA